MSSAGSLEVKPAAEQSAQNTDMHLKKRVKLKSKQLDLSASQRKVSKEKEALSALEKCSKLWGIPTPKSHTSLP